MRATGYRESGDIGCDDALTDIELPTPELAGRNILIQVRAVSVNPVNMKVRKSGKPEQGEWKVLGWDAGIVFAVGSDATLFRPGDEVFYAGAIGRPGTNSEYRLVDERIVGTSRGRWTGPPWRRCR